MSLMEDKTDLKDRGVYLEDWIEHPRKGWSRVSYKVLCGTVTLHVRSVNLSRYNYAQPATHLLE